jgi:hypothetical protein
MAIKNSDKCMFANIIFMVGVITAPSGIKSYLLAMQIISIVIGVYFLNKEFKAFKKQLDEETAQWIKDAKDKYGIK